MITTSFVQSEGFKKIYAILEFKIFYTYSIHILITEVLNSCERFAHIYMQEI